MGGFGSNQVMFTNGSTQKSNYDVQNLVTHNSNRDSTRTSANKDIEKSGSQKKDSSRIEKPITKVDDTILQERDQLIKYIKQYIKKNNELPPTTLNFYKFVKLIGKGAFGKVTLGVHKLTGK